MQNYLVRSTAENQSVIRIYSTVAGTDIQLHLFLFRKDRSWQKTLCKGDTITYRAIQGPQLLRDWSVGDPGQGCDCDWSVTVITPAAAEILLSQFQMWFLACEIKH